MDTQLSENLLLRIRTNIEETAPPELYWDYRDTLSPGQINKILALPNGWNEVKNDIFELNIDHIHNEEREHLREPSGITDLK